MNRNLFRSLIIIHFLTFPCFSFASEVSANLGVTSNYIWRGVTQSDKNISLSAGADYSSTSGMYAGIWAASVDFNDDTRFEYDVYGGFQTSFSNVDMDIGYIYYGYQGGNDLAFSEAYIKATYENFSFAISTLFDSEAGGDFADASYIEAAYSFALAYDISLGLHAGHYDFDQGGNYQDFNISLTKGDFSLMVSKVTGNSYLDDNLLSLSYSKAFDF